LVLRETLNLFVPKVSYEVQVWQREYEVRLPRPIIEPSRSPRGSTRIEEKGILQLTFAVS
ncbi:hypothetical protein Tco_1472693, partial [Tanacetum coccineum]